MLNINKQTRVQIMPYFTSIGSRRITPEARLTIRAIARAFCELGFVMRSGGAEGADDESEKGCDEVNGHKEIYVPWKGFNGRYNGIMLPDELFAQAQQMASQVHPAWGACSDVARKMHTRNVPQVLGKDLRTPSQFVVCWTPDGAETTTTRDTGGTGQAIRLAYLHHVRVYNIARPESLEAIRALYKKLR